MTSPHILFTSPLASRIDGPPIRVIGELAGYTSGAAYEGRLDVVDAIGACTVEMVSGSLPGGATIRMDNAESQVVVAWPAMVHGTTEVPNGSFESGDVGWEKGAGWLIGTGSGFDAYAGSWSAAYTGRGEASIVGLKVPVVPGGAPITATIQVQQGASSAGSVGACVRLFWYDSVGRMLPGGEGYSYSSGNFVRSGSNGAWHPSTVTAAPPAAARHVALGASSKRARQGHRLWVDAASWSHAYTPGQDGDDRYCITLRVTDSVGRSALWSGCVGEQAIYLTSKPYGYESPIEAYTVGLGVDSMRLRTPPTYGYQEAYTVGLGVQAIDLRSPLQGYIGPPEAYGPMMSVSALDLRTILLAYTAWPPEAYGPTLAVNALDIKQVLISQTQPVEAYGPTLAITGVTIT